MDRISKHDAWVERQIDYLDQAVLVRPADVVQCSAGNSRRWGMGCLAIAALIESGIARTFLIVVGGGILAITAIASVKNAWPDSIVSWQAVEGKTLRIPDLDAIHPPIPRLGIVGIETVGKSTLTGRLLRARFGSLVSCDG